MLLCVLLANTPPCVARLGVCMCSSVHVRPRPDSAFKLVRQGETNRVVS